jgi:hypothetical protein
MLSQRYKSYGLLLLLSLICASVNVTKAVHIDDAGDLQITRRILEDPLHPMSGELNRGVFGLILTATLGILLALSDYYYACG